MDVAPTKAAYGGGLEAVDEWVSRVVSKMFKAKQVLSVPTNPKFTAS